MQSIKWIFWLTNLINKEISEDNLNAERMLSRVVVVAVLHVFATCVCQRSEMCTVLTRSQMTYVLTDAQRQELICKSYNFSQDPYNGIYTFTANPDSKLIKTIKYQLD